MMMLTEAKFIKKTLTRMFRMVGRKYTPESTAKPDWYQESTWTRKQEAQFKAWLATVIERDLMYTRPAAERRAGWFILVGFDTPKLASALLQKRQSSTFWNASQLAARIVYF